MIFAGTPSAGELLIAAAGTEDPYFSETVVLLLDRDDSGALGVVLTRPAQIALNEVLPDWQDLVSPPQLLFDGGPVSPQGAICVAQANNSFEDPPGWRRISDDIGLLHLDTPTEIVEGAYSGMRIFAGYAGWAAGQLEGEILRGAWHRTPARASDIFSVDYAGLWRRVLRRCGGDAGLESTWTDRSERN